MLRLYNTLSRSIEDFKPLESKKVSIYVCGPTVYDVPHIGHARSAYCFDVLRRTLQFKGYEVRFVRNVTDVDDKIIQKAREELGARSEGQGEGDLKAKCKEVAERYLKGYHEAMDRLDIRRPDIEPKATEHVVPTMTDLVGKLLVSGSAYEAEGDVYFAVRHSPEYGRLSNRSIDELQAGARVEPGEHKRDPLDFALWKAAKSDEPFWKSPWGYGRPGWHIECSAMSTKYLGDTFDIHGGGLDLIFPHHENEIAQSIAAGKPFAKYWIHHGLLTVGGEKMSKSLGNTITVDRALTDSQGKGDTLKVFFLSTHYRSPIDYNLQQVQAAYARWSNFNQLFSYAEIENKHVKQRESAVRGKISLSPALAKGLKGIEDKFDGAMANDLNTPQALASLDEIVVFANKLRRQVTELEQSGKPVDEGQYQQTRDDSALGVVAAKELLLRLGREVFGLFTEYAESPVELSPQQKAKLREREEARTRKDFRTADRIRQELQAEGWIIEDRLGKPDVRRKQ